MRLLRTVLLVIIFSFLLSFTACKNTSDGGEDSPSNGESSSPEAPEEAEKPDDSPEKDAAYIEINSFRIGYLTEDDYREGNFTDANITEAVSFPDEENRYMVLDFTYTLLKDIGSGNKISLETTFPGRGVLDITTEDAPTSDTEEIEGLGGTTLSLGFSLPIEASATRSVRVLLRLLPISGGDVICTLKLTAPEHLTLYGKTEIHEKLNTGEPRVIYEINPDGKSYSVASVKDTMTTLTIPSKLNDGLPVTAIKDGAFMGCTYIENVTLGEFITTIGDEAFSNCENLVSINLPDRLTAIGEQAFSDCSSLNSVTLGPSVTNIGFGAFCGCSSMESITLSFTGEAKDGAQKTNFGYIFGSESFGGHEKFVPESLKTVRLTSGTVIDSFTFYGCKGIAHIILPDSITAIEKNAFAECSGLLSINLPDTLEYISESAFAYCKSLKEVKIPTSIWCIREYCFVECESLTDVYIPEGVSSIDETAFLGCSNIKRFEVSTENKNFKVVDGNLYSKDGTKFIYCVLSESALAVIPEGVKSISPYAFFKKENLICVEFPTTLQKIGAYAFQGCSRLATVTLPGGLNSIDTGAFNGCNNLLEVVNRSSLSIIKNSTAHGNIAYSAKRISTAESVMVELDGLIYLPLDNDVYLMGYTGDECDLVLPNSLSGRTYQIYSHAFESANITSIVIPKGVTKISEYAFRDCSALLRAEIGSLGDIGNYAFSNCINLKTITIGEGAKLIGDFAFENCEALGGVKIPDSVIVIGRWAFNNCYSIKNVTLGSGLTEIEEAAFQCCVSLKGIHLPDSVKIVHDYAFNQCHSLSWAKLGAGLETIGTSAFGGRITSVELPKNIQSIGKNAFYSKNLVEIINHSSLNIKVGSTEHGGIARGVFEVHRGDTKAINQNGFIFYTYGGVNYLITYVGEDTEPVLPESYNGQTYVIRRYAFYNNTDITKVTISDKVTSIENNAFDDATNLEYVKLGANVTDIGDKAFTGCAIKSVYIPEGLRNLADNAFDSLAEFVVSEGNSVYKSIDGNLYSKDGTRLLKYANGKTDSRFYVPEGVTEIGGSAFSEALYLKKIILPDGLLKIGSSAFSGCLHLRSIAIPNSVTELGGGAFDFCTELKTVTLGQGITVINECTFRNCESLSGIVIPVGVTTIRENAFSDCRMLKTVVMPSTVVDIYPGAFSGNTSVSKVFYEGDEASWKKATRVTNAFKNSTVHFGYAYENQDSDSQ